MPNIIAHMNYSDLFNVIVGSSFIVAAYLLGSVCAAIWVCRLFKLPDPRQMGSNNPGATNVVRASQQAGMVGPLAKLPALITFLVDALKALPCVLVANSLELSITWLSFIALAAVVGHMLPVWYSFKGGKGIATAFGVLLVLKPILFVLATLGWGCIFVLTRISAVAGLGVFVCMIPITSYFLANSLLPMFIILAILIIWRHKTNIKAIIL